MYESTLVADISPYDQFMDGNPNAISAQALSCDSSLIPLDQAGDGLAKDAQTSFAQLCAAQPPIFHPPIDRPPADREQFSRLSDSKHSFFHRAGQRDLFLFNQGYRIPRIQ